MDPLCPLAHELCVMISGISLFSLDVKSRLTTVPGLDTLKKLGRRHAAFSRVSRSSLIPDFHRSEQKGSPVTLNNRQTDELLQRGFSRRHLGRIASLLTAGAALPFYNEFAMAQQDLQRRGGRGAMDPNAVRINQN